MDTPPNNIHTIVRAQIVFLLSTLTEENFAHNQAEIRSLSDQHGVETYLHFIRRLIVHSQARLTGGPGPGAFDASSALTFRLLVQEAQRLGRDPYMAERFRDGIDRGEGDVFRHFDLLRFNDRLALRPIERLILASAIVAGPNVRKELVQQAVTVIRIEFDAAVLALAHEQVDLVPHQLAKLLSNLLALPSPDTPVLDAHQRETLLAAAHAKYGPEVIAPMLQQIFPHLSLQPGTSFVQAFNQLGPKATSDTEAVLALLLRFGTSETNPPSDALVLEFMHIFARQTVEGVGLGDIGALVRALSSLNNSIQWSDAIRAFDISERAGVDTATLKLLIAILVNSPREPPEGVDHAVTGFWSPWRNSLYQLRLLDALLSLPSDTFSFYSLPGRRIVTMEDVTNASPTIKTLAANVQGNTWNSLDLFEVLVRAAESENEHVQQCVREMFDKAMRISAELVHMGLLEAPQPVWCPIRKEYSDRLLSMFLAGHPNHQLVFMRIWQIRPVYLTDAFRSFYEDNPLNITRILDVAQDLKILDALLDVKPFAFALDVASLASRREYLNLDKWLSDNIAQHGAEFLHAIIEFLDVKMESEKTARVSDPAEESRTMPLNPHTITVFLRLLRNNSPAIPKEDVDYALDVRNLCLQMHPRLMSLMPNSDTEPGFAVVNYPADVEAEVDGIFKRMYEEQITIDDVISLLQRNKSSTVEHDNQIFSCMIHFLFDEYKFFQTWYPARELAMTGYLFGSIIQYELVDYIPLGIAIRYVIDALNCPPETNLFKFGLQALARFEGRLPEWQPLCQALLEIPHLPDARPDLVMTLHRGMAQNGDAGAKMELGLRTGSVPPLHAHAEQPPLFTSIRPDTELLERATLEEPPEDVSDRILFIINNLAPINFDAKLEDMRGTFEDAYTRWFANYVVDQRVSSEPNNHALYLRFLDAMGKPMVHKLVLQETIAKSAMLLNADRTMTSAAERTVLKNLGSWLGSITLARDRPVKFRNMSFKDLLLEGYDAGRLLLAIPFVCKTLEPAARSTVFLPPNPWLMAVLGLLVELYHYAELKLNLKFEIEVLCKALDIDLDSIDPSIVLRSRPIAGPELPDAVRDIDALPMGGYDPTGGALGDAQILALGGGVPGGQARAVDVQLEQHLGELAQRVAINPSFVPMPANAHSAAHFKRAVQLAVDRAVREIIMPVVERSITIASISTRELVQKDFATEGDERRVQGAAHAMARRLAGSLALVTCKEPLRTNMAAHVRTFLGEHGFGEQAVPDAVVLLLVEDNIEAACGAIEKAAMEHAVPEVDSAFGPLFDARRRHRQTSRGPYFDAANVVAQAHAQLPDPLRLNQGGVTQEQMFVYEAFAREADAFGFSKRVGVPQQQQQQQPPFARPESAAGSFSGVVGQQEEYLESPPPSSGMLQGQDMLLAHQETSERFSALAKELDTRIAQAPFPTLNSLPPGSDIRQISRRMLGLALGTTDRARTPITLTQRLVQNLYKATTALGREVYCALLQSLCEAFEHVRAEAIPWLIYSEDERKLSNPAVTVTLLKSGLVPFAAQDQQLGKSLAGEPKPAVQNFAAALVRECLTADPPFANQASFPFTIEVLGEIVKAGNATHETQRLVDDLRPIRRPASTDSGDTSALREKLLIWFQQWVGLFQRSPAPEKAFVPFITQLTRQGILKMDETSSFFFRVCAEASVSSYLKAAAQQDFSYAYQSLDAMSRLIVYMIKYHGDASGMDNTQAKVHYLTKILSIFVLVLAATHEEQGSAFQQKPFLRFFSSLVNDLASVEESLGAAYFHALLAIGDTFSSLQPTYFPGFAFSWMSLISHRLFMPKLLMSANREGWAAFHKLLLALFRFLAPILRSAHLQASSRDLYRGALRLLLVLLHDFPEFLSEYYFSLCDAIPPRCVQMRNIILSAYPTDLIPPDPHLRGIRFDAIPDMGPIPPVLSDFTATLNKNGGEELRAALDAVLLARAPPSPGLLQALVERIRAPANTPDPAAVAREGYNVQLLNSIIMYIGVSSVAQAKASSGSALFNPAAPGVGLIRQLAAELEPEGQYLLLNSLTLHLRYPNAHTHWYICLFLNLFVEVQDDLFGEVLTRVLLERFIVHRPHPWGALVAFIELLKNQKYGFWERKFVTAVPEIAALLSNVASSIFQQT